MGITNDLTSQLYADELMPYLVQGIRDGKQDSVSDAPYIEPTLGFKPDVYTVKALPTEIGRLQPGVLGATYINQSGKAYKMRINDWILDLGMMLKEKYQKSMDWTKKFVYSTARDTTHHEDYHIMSAELAKEEDITPQARDLMESITTRGRYKVAKERGNEQMARMIEKTNPYPAVWKLSEIADWAPYNGPSGAGYNAFLSDAQKEKFYKPLGRLAWAATKSGWRKAADYISGRSPAYAAA